jgi:hypothetical protein
MGYLIRREIEEIRKTRRETFIICAISIFIFAFPFILGALT